MTLAKLLVPAAAAMLAAQAQAASFEFESEPYGVHAGGVSLSDGGIDLTITAEGSPGYFVAFTGDAGIPGLLGNVTAIGSSTNPLALGRFVPLRFSFAQSIASITFDFGDIGGDDDSPYLIQAFDASDRLLGSATGDYAEDYALGKSVTLSFADARYFIASSGSVIGNPNSLGWEISSVTAAAPSVPEPASWTMMIAGFGLAGATLRARKHQRITARSAG